MHTRGAAWAFVSHEQRQGSAGLAEEVDALAIVLGPGAAPTDDAALDDDATGAFVLVGTAAAPAHATTEGVVTSATL